MKINKSTIVRLIMYIIVIINIVLEKKGLDLIKTDESTIATIVEQVIEIGVFIVGFWKNNSFTPAAIKADEFMRELKASDSLANDEWEGE